MREVLLCKVPWCWQMISQGWLNAQLLTDCTSPGCVWMSRATASLSVFSLCSPRLRASKCEIGQAAPTVRAKCPAPAGTSQVAQGRWLWGTCQSIYGCCQLPTRNCMVRWGFLSNVQIRALPAEHFPFSLQHVKWLLLVSGFFLFSETSLPH